MTEPQGGKLHRDKSYLTILQARDRWKPAELLFWVALGSIFFIFPTNLVFASQILITGLFALSLDLLLGYGGIVTLGHAAFFGLGAYTAGLLAVHGWHEPLSGLLAAGLVAGVVGYLTSFFLLRGGGDDATDDHSGDRPAALRNRE